MKKYHSVLLWTMFCFIAMLPGHLCAQDMQQRTQGRGIESFPYPFNKMHYVQPRFDRVNYDDGTYFDSYVIRAFTTSWDNMHFRLDIPLADTNKAGGHVFGLSDISLRAVHAQRLHDKLFLGYGLQLDMNTATNDALGGGKWDLRPGIGIVYFRGAPQDVTGTMELSLEYRTTIAKEAGRTRTNILAISPNIDWWFRKWFIGYYATWTYDFESDLFTLPFDVEAGYNIIPNLTLSAEFIFPITRHSPYDDEFAIKLRYSFK